RLPQHVLAAQAPEPAKHILKRVVERMPHVQGTGDIGWRDDNAKGFRGLPVRPAGAKCARRLPGGVNAALNVGGLISLVDHRRFGFPCLRAKKPPMLRPVNAPAPRCSKPFATRARAAL